VVTGSWHRELPVASRQESKFRFLFRARQVMAGPESETQLEFQTEFAAELQHQTKTMLLY
jgi:hypothetical protein